MKKHITILFAIITQLAFAQKEEKKIAGIHTGNLTSLTVSFDGSKALTGASDSRANLWNTLAGNKLKGFAAQDKEITDVKFNSDESLFATSSRNMSIVIWDGATQKPKKILKETAEVLAITFNPFNNNLVSVSSTGSVKLWDATGGKVLQENLVALDEKDISTASVQYSRDGKYLGIHVNEKIYLFKNDGKLISSFAAAKNKSSKQSFDISPDAKLLVYKNTANQLALVSVETGTTKETLSVDVKGATFVSFAQNNEKLILGNENGKVQIYSITEKRTIKEFTAHEGAVINAGISRDGNVLITTGADMSLKRWSISDLNLNYCQQPESCPRNAVISNLAINDENQNGLLDGGEKISLTVTIKNSDPSILYGATLKLSMTDKLEGLDIPTEIFGGNITGSTSKTVTIPLTVAPQLASGSTTLNADLMCSGGKLSNKTLALQTGSSVNAGVAVKSYKFYSPSGKSARGEPITMVLTIENVTRIVAENVQVIYKYPAGLSAIDKSKETIARIAPGATTTISVQFIADKNLTANEVTIGLDISGVAYSNAGELKMALPLNQTIGTQQDMMAMLENKSGEVAMRGSMTLSKADMPSMSIEGSRNVALVIGIDNYEGTWTKLDNATRDAKAVEDVLKKNYNFSVVRSLYDKAATRQAIIGEFEWLVANLKQSDNLIIFYSGHGDYKESLNRGFWVPVDAVSNSTSNFISNPDLQTFLASIKAKHTLLISDACFSGDIFRGGDQKNPSEVNDKYYNRVNTLASRQAITSGGIEPVMDGGKDGHSVFTYYFLKALKENNQKYIDATQLFDAIKIPVVNNSSQAPKFSHIKNTGDEGGEFIFLKK